MTDHLSSEPCVEPQEKPRQSGAETLVELLGLSGVDELSRKASYAGWDGARFREENKLPGMAQRFAEAIDAGLDAELERRRTRRMENVLAAGPLALADWPAPALSALIKDSRLRAIAADYDPFLSGGRLVCGPTGIGKSVAGIAALRRCESLKRHDLSLTDREEFMQEHAGTRERVRRNAWARAFDLPNARLANGLGKGEAELVSAAIKADFLVLDDLGWESRRAGADDVVTEVIAARYDAGRFTYATTGLSLEQFGERYGSAVIRKLTESRVKGSVLDLWPKESRH